MAPELIRGDENIIPIKCDVYSYGILFDNTIWEIFNIVGITIL